MIPELVTVHTSLLTDLGDAVRAKTGGSEEMTLGSMEEKVSGLDTTAIVSNPSSAIKHIVRESGITALNKNYMIMTPQSAVGTNLTPFSNMQTDYRVVIKFKHTGGSSTNRGVVSSVAYDTGYKLIPSFTIRGSDTTYHFTYGDNEVVFSHTADTTNWYIVVMRYDADNGLHICSLYNENGELIEAQSIRGSVSTSSSGIAIGNWRGNNGDNFYGDFDLGCSAIIIDGNTVWGQLPERFANIGIVDVDYTDPTQFQKCEYIQGSGSQYITTDYYMTPTSRVVADMQFTAASNQARVFNSQTTNSNYSTYSVYINGGGYWATAHKDGQGDWTSTNVYANTSRHTFDFYANHYFKVDSGTTVDKTFTNATTHNSERPIVLLHNDGGTETGAAKIYSVKAYDGETFVRDYRPSYNIYTGEIGLFDYANNTFLRNAGTGVFTKGADI